MTNLPAPVGPAHLPQARPTHIPRIFTSARKTLPQNMLHGFLASSVSIGLAAMLEGGRAIVWSAIAQLPKGTTDILIIPDPDDLSPAMRAVVGPMVDGIISVVAIEAGLLITGIAVHLSGSLQGLLRMAREREDDFESPAAEIPPLTLRDDEYSTEASARRRAWDMPAIAPKKAEP